MISVEARPPTGRVPVDTAIYPDSDGMPMADNTLQFQFIVMLKLGFANLFRDRDDVFVAGDLLWYPVQGDSTIRVAPDTLIAFGRPPGYRGSYKQWQEDGIAPQIVWEVLSPGNRPAEMQRKFEFYERYGVEEYMIYDPDNGTLEGWTRDRTNRLRRVPDVLDWTSPLTGVRFRLVEGLLEVIRPDGVRFEFGEELAAKADAEKQRADAEKQRADAEKQRADAEKQRAEMLAAKLRDLGIDPDRI